MNLGATLSKRIGREIQERFAAERKALSNEFNEARAAAGDDGVAGIELAAFAERMEDLATRQADAFMMKAKPLLLQIAGSRNGRRQIKRKGLLAKMREHVRRGLLPGGMTAAEVRRELEQAAAKDEMVIGFFLEALEDAE